MLLFLPKTALLTFNQPHFEVRVMYIVHDSSDRSNTRVVLPLNHMTES